MDKVETHWVRPVKINILLIVNLNNSQKLCQPEEDVRREGCEGAGQHALGERFEEDCEWNHRKPELRPPAKFVFLNFNFN